MVETANYNGDNVLKFPGTLGGAPVGRSLSGGGGDGTSDDMENRVVRLEEDMKEIKANLKILVEGVPALRADLNAGMQALRTDLVRDNGSLKVDLIREMGTVRSDVSGLKGELTSRPNTWQVIVMIGAIGTLLVAGQLGAVFAFFKQHQ